MEAKTSKLFEFINYAEKLKTEYRAACKSDGLREDVAGHSWRVALIITLILPKLKVKVDELKLLKMAIIHDIIEIEAKDIPVLQHIVDEDLKNTISQKELAAIEKIKHMLGEDGEEIAELWKEYELQSSVEAKVLKAVDRLEGQWQFLSEDVYEFRNSEVPAVKELFRDTTEICKIDPILAELDRESSEARDIRMFGNLKD